MSGRALLQAAVVARLRAVPSLAPMRIYDAPPARATLPYAQLEEPLVGDWSTKSWAGIEARLTLLAFDGGERPVRLRALVDAAEAAMLTLPAGLGDGWRLATIVLLRSRIARSGDRWTAASEFRARLSCGE